MLHKPLPLKSPAIPAALLLYSIVFGFAATSYLAIPWQRTHTMALYFAISVWGLAALVRRWRDKRPTFNRLDFLFGAFLTLVLASVAVNWWDGNIKQLEFMPVFFVLPYLFGRAMIREDVGVFRRALVWMGAALLLLVLVEYVHVFRFGLPYENSPVPTLFGQGHGVMLSGLLLAATFLTLVSVALRPIAQVEPCAGGLWRQHAPHLGFGLIVVAMGWIASRGSVLATMVAMTALLVCAPRGAWREKVKVIVVFVCFVVLTVTLLAQDRYKSAYYATVVQRPVIVETPDNEVIEAGRPAKLASTPILGKASCRAIVESVSERWILYQQALAMFAAKPIFGVGANDYGFHACAGPGSFPHSTILQVMSELGIVGTLLYLSLILAVAWVLVGAKRKSTGSGVLQVNSAWIFAFFILQLLVAQFYGDYFVSANLYFVCGLAASLREQSRREGMCVQSCVS